MNEASLHAQDQSRAAWNYSCTRNQALTVIAAVTVVGLATLAILQLTGAFDWCSPVADFFTHEAYPAIKEFMLQEITIVTWKVLAVTGSILLGAFMCYRAKKVLFTQPTLSDRINKLHDDEFSSEDLDIDQPPNNYDQGKGNVLKNSPRIVELDEESEIEGSDAEDASQANLKVEVPPSNPTQKEDVTVGKKSELDDEQTQLEMNHPGKVIDQKSAESERQAQDISYKKLSKIIGPSTPLDQIKSYILAECEPSAVVPVIFADGKVHIYSTNDQESDDPAFCNVKLLITLRNTTRKLYLTHLQDLNKNYGKTIYQPIKVSYYLQK